MQEQRNKFLLVLFFLILLGGCTSSGPPIREMVFASAAMKASERVGSEKFSPDLFRKAENEFWRAKSFYAAKRFDECKRSAYLARRYAENAELQSEIKRSEAGYEGLE